MTTTALQVKHTLDTLRVLPLTLQDLISLPDPEAAEGLNIRMQLLDMVDAAHAVTYSQRLVIIAEFRRRSLWRYLIDPEVGEVFPHETAWLSSGFVGCRRVNFEAKKDAENLADVEPAKLIDMPKASIKVLTSVSTAVRNDPEVLAAAKAGEDKLLEKLETDHPGQHIERRKPMTIRPTRSERKVIDAAVEWAMEHGIAGSITEAIVRGMETALNQWQLDDELDHLQVEQKPEVI